MTFLSSLELAASCPLNKDIQAEGDRANDSHAFYESYISHRGRKSHSVTAEGSGCSVTTHINLLADNPFPGWLLLVIFKWHISGCVTRGDSSKFGFLSPAAAMFPYLEVCPWNQVIRPLRVPRWESLLIDKSTTGTSRRSIHSLDCPTQH